VLNIRTATTRKYISRHDDAVDRKKMKDAAWTRFVEGEIEIEKVPLRPGCKPSIFSLRRLSRKQFLSVMDVGTQMAQAQEAVAYGLVGWENFAEVQPVTEPSDLGPRLSEACMDSIFVPEVVRELGLVVIGMSMLGPTKEPG
jgi:hypothetical protein